MYLVQTLLNCVLFHNTQAGHLHLNNINNEPKTKEGYNFVSHHDMNVAFKLSSFQLGTSTVEFFSFVITFSVLVNSNVQQYVSQLFCIRFLIQRV
jgi:hypothetical protein